MLNRTCKHCSSPVSTTRGPAVCDACCTTPLSTRSWARLHPDRINQASRKWREQHPNRFKASYETWRANNPAKVKAWKDANAERRCATDRAWRAANPERSKEIYRKSYYRRTYGMSESDVRTMFENQEGLCCICSRLMSLSRKPTDPSGRACVDHNHATGKVRGLLCALCNSGLGMFKESATALYNAIGYVRVA